jgi:hypothetical protein
MALVMHAQKILVVVIENYDGYRVVGLADKVVFPMRSFFEELTAGCL